MSVQPLALPPLGWGCRLERPLGGKSLVASPGRSSPWPGWTARDKASVLIRVFTAALLINSERTRKSVHSRVGDQGTAHGKPPAAGATAHGRLLCTLVSGGSRTQEQTLSEFQGQASCTMAPGDRGRLPLGVGDRCGGGRAAVPGTRNTCISIPLHKGSECQSPPGVPIRAGTSLSVQSHKAQGLNCEQHSPRTYTSSPSPAATRSPLTRPYQMDLCVQAAVRRRSWRWC